MPIITLEEVKDFLGEQSDDNDVKIARLIPIVTDRIRRICNNPFTVQEIREAVYNRFTMRDTGILRFDRDETLYILAQVDATFSASTRTVIATGENFASAGFAAGQDIFVYKSYRNDGYYVVSSVSTSTLTILSGYSFTGAIANTHGFFDEATGASIYFAVVSWPPDIKPAVASMIQFDYQERGSWRDVEGSMLHGMYGYPKTLLRSFDDYTVPAYGMNYK